MKGTDNIEEEFNFKDEYYLLGKALCERIIDHTNHSFQKTVIVIGGESGCGKSTTAFCLEKELMAKGFNCTTVHMDSYFILPPKDNHQNRMESLNNVGPHELDMPLLNEHIIAFKSNKKNITIPVVNYRENIFSEKDLDLSNTEVLIIEGVYSFLLKNIDHKIFLSRTYRETFQNRIKRTREDYDPLIELVLEIEHKIVSPLIDKADFVIDKNYSIK